VVQYQQEGKTATCWMASAVSGFSCDSVAPTTVDVGGGALKIAADASVVSGSAQIDTSA